jgi:hypothetical protein
VTDEKKKSAQVPATAGKNVFEEFADRADRQMAVGSLLKFVKGDFVVGRDEKCVEKELVAIMPGLLHGWQRWEDSRPADHAMGLLIEGFVPPTRDVLGYRDETSWEIKDGKPRDPWRLTIYLPMVTVNCESVLTFTTDSDGGRRRCMAPLSGEYGKHIRQHPDELPVIRLEQSSYQHPDRSRGRIKYPIFPVDRWVKAEPYSAAITAITGRSLPLLPGSTT